VVFEVFLL